MTLEIGALLPYIISWVNGVRGSQSCRAGGVSVCVAYGARAVLLGRCVHLVVSS